jgi:hypothetical protein
MRFTFCFLHTLLLSESVSKSQQYDNSRVDVCKEEVRRETLSLFMRSLFGTHPGHNDGYGMGVLGRSLTSDTRKGG